MKKANVEAEDEDGVRPLHLAARSGSLPTCSVLLRHSADTEAKDADGRTAFEHVQSTELCTQAERRAWAALLCKSDKSTPRQRRAVFSSRESPPQGGIE